jgi:hypothetical protein
MTTIARRRFSRINLADSNYDAIATVGGFDNSLPVVRVGMPAEEREYHEESDEVGNSDIPAVAKPQTDRFRLRVNVGQSNASRRTEPDNGPAEPDRIG